MTGFLNEIFKQTLGTDFAPKKKKKKPQRRARVNVHYHSNHRGLADLNRQQADLQRQINSLKNGR
jgi:hypothetical protein